MPKPLCRFCATPLVHTFADLGVSPISNALLESTSLTEMEPFYPLHAFVCSSCLLVQLEELQGPEAIFRDYAYFSSFSTSWLSHCKAYVENVCPRFNLDDAGFVVELASNDGYLLQYFKARGIRVLGIEPARNVAAVAIERGIPTVSEFFGETRAVTLEAEHGSADLIAANNVLAHVPDLNDFVAGIRVLLKTSGVATIEFPHLLRLIESTQFDTIYHEHFSYFSLITAQKVFSKHHLEIFDVEELSTHGGSLRLYVGHRGVHEMQPSVTSLLALERTAGLDDVANYLGFQGAVDDLKRTFVTFLIEAKRAGKTIAGYGAAAKGSTLLNYCGARTDFIDYIVDANPRKQNRLLPGCRIPIYPVERIAETHPDYVLILPWNIADEVMEQMAHVRDWGGQFVSAVPTVAIR